MTIIQGKSYGLTCLFNQGTVEGFGCEIKADGDIFEGTFTQNV